MALSILAEFYITKDTPHGPEALGCFVRKRELLSRGTLYDPISVQWRVLNSNEVVVESGNGVKFLDLEGVYFATPDVESNLPEDQDFLIQWTIDHGSETEVFSVPFSVLPPSYELGRRSYVNPARLIREGIGGALDPLQWRRVCDMVDGTVETMTGNIFRPVVDALTVRGGGTRTLYLEMPIVGVSFILEDGLMTRYRDSLKVSWDGEAKGFYGQQFRNPSIKGRLFGPVEYYVHGAFGFVNDKGLPPPMVAEASYRLALHSIDHINQQVAGGGAPVVNAVRPAVIAQETVDRHSIKYDTGRSSVNAGTTTSSPTLKTAEIEAMLRQYRRPMRVRASSALRR